ncbi:MAG: RDD family protein [Xanthomonadales bacterium]|nr:RDD family protein [Xanthomonadales bacterium]
MDKPAALDTFSHFETPEGVVLTMSVAGPVTRALAWLVDAVIRYSIVFAIAIVGSTLGNLGNGLLFLTIFLMEWLYPVVFEVLKGATPGKKQLGLAVVHADGTPLTWSSSLIRNLLRAVDFLPFLYGLGLLSMLIHPQFKRLGDMAAGTLVVHVTANGKRRAIPKTEPLPLQMVLSANEERAILDFAERSEQLSPSRADELAQHVVQALIERGYVNSTAGESASQTLVRIANSLVRS